jgi:choline dehydrogenase-like flavoprotein
MIKDLSQVESPGIEERVGVCIIGAGTAGIYLAQRLRTLGERVLMLEAGDSLARRPDEVAQTCEQRGIRYRGAELGRSFGLGGTSALWGGQMIPLTASDMASRPAVGIDAWPIAQSDLTAHIPRVKALLGLPAGDDPANSGFSAKRFPALTGLDADFDLRLSQWLPFGKRNLAKAFAKPLQTDSDLVVWLNAAVVRFDSDTEGCIQCIEARSHNGRTLLVRPQKVVIAAGALESTRLLLAFDDDWGGKITAGGAPLGRYFADHLSVTCGRFHPLDRRRYNHAVAPIFVDGIMRTPRLELSGNAQERLALTSAFAHFTFVTHGETGFDVVRNLLRRRQGEQQGPGLSPGRLGRVIHDVSAMAYWRGRHRRLWIPSLAELLLQVDIEQVPNRNSGLSLADDRDHLGRKRLVIDWQITAQDVEIIRRVADLVAKAWKRSKLQDLAQVEITLPSCFDDFESLYDVYHPTGTLRMGARPNDSVVDKDLRVWGLKNCYVSSTAVFPSAGSANPGLMHLALTDRLAEHLNRLLP